MVNIFLGLDLSLKDYRCTIMYLTKQLLAANPRCSNFFTWVMTCLLLILLFQDLDSFELDQLEFKTLAECPYLENANLKRIYLYHSSS